MGEVELIDVIGVLREIVEREDEGEDVAAHMGRECGIRLSAFSSSRVRVNHRPVSHTPLCQTINSLS